MKKETKVISNIKEVLQKFGNWELIRVSASTKRGVSDLILLFQGVYIAIEVKTDADLSKFLKGNSLLQVCHLLDIYKSGGIGLVVTHHETDLISLHNLLDWINVNDNLDITKDYGIEDTVDDFYVNKEKLQNILDENIEICNIELQ